VCSLHQLRHLRGKKRKKVAGPVDVFIDLIEDGEGIQGRGKKSSLIFFITSMKERSKFPCRAGKKRVGTKKGLKRRSAQPSRPREMREKTSLNQNPVGPIKVSLNLKYSGERREEVSVPGHD